MLLNVEYKIQKLAYATLTCPKTKVDIAKELISDGLMLVDSRREKRLQKVVSLNVRIMLIFLKTKVLH